MGVVLGNDSGYNIVALDDVAARLRKMLGEEWVITERELIESYLSDETPEPVKPKPAERLILVKPASTEEVSLTLKLANENKIPVFPVGGRTGLAGGCIPTIPGIVLSLERMNKIEVDEENLMAVAEAGATLRDLIRAAEGAGLFFPPHPGDESAQIGGLIATNAGGVRAVKYGVIRNYIKGLEVVLPSGEVLNVGGKLLKNNVGYDLMQLIIGSEGTLCVITKAVIKLFPKSQCMVTLIVPFNSRSDALKSVPEILRSGVTPLAIEYVQLNEIKRAAEHLGERWPIEKGFAQLIIMLDGMRWEEVLSACEEVARVCQSYNAIDVLIADSQREQNRILRIRSNMYTAIKRELVDILDVTVPPARLGDLMNAVDEIAAKYGIYLPVYGHAGDGNLHVHIMRDAASMDIVEKIRHEIYMAAIKLGGTITGEHGIGKIRVKSLNLLLNEKYIELMRFIKRVFDPNNILNPRDYL
ncbi:FAD-binding oxidoreductase [Candidatus Bathyarchaeota archaeon]|nr:FAD-binding oxidoreductase [Candidatus Bathyarchaeota archaeon]